MSARRMLLALSCVVGVLATVNANAQTLPAQGPVSVTYTSTLIAPAKAMPIGSGKEYALLNAAMTASNDGGNPILNNMGGRCLFSRSVDIVAKTSELHGFCTYSDYDGDQIFEKCDFLPGAPNDCK